MRPFFLALLVLAACGGAAPSPTLNRYSCSDTQTCNGKTVYGAPGNAWCASSIDEANAKEKEWCATAAGCSCVPGCYLEHEGCP
jgi:hypothetical protein